jgi:hypothetical protein
MSIRMRSLVFGVASGGLLCAALALPVAGAVAEPVPPSQPSDGLTPQPQAEFDLGDLLTFASQSTDMTSSGAGFVGQIGDVANRSATLYFTNPTKVPASLADEAGKANLKVTIESWPYSTQALSQAVDRLQARYGGTLPDGFKITFYATFDTSGFAGITIKGSYSPGASASQLPNASTQAAVQSVAQLPVRFQASQGTFALISGRAAD